MMDGLMNRWWKGGWTDAQIMIVDGWVMMDDGQTDGWLYLRTVKVPCRVLLPEEPNCWHLSWRTEKKTRWCVCRFFSHTIKSAAYFYTGAFLTSLFRPFQTACTGRKSLSLWHHAATVSTDSTKPDKKIPMTSIWRKSEVFHNWMQR